MLRLDNTTRKLQALLGGSITTNQLPITVCYSDKTATAYTGGTTVINTNNTTAVDICAAPAASTVRDIDTINVNNADTVAATITIRYNDNGTTYTLFKAQLATGDQLTYVHGDGWKVLDSAGVIKSFSPTDLKLSSFAPTTSAELATVITDETGSGLLVFGTSPTLTTPNIGAATATSINGNTITAGTGTLTLGAGSTLATSATNSITLTSTGATNVTLPTTGTLATLAGTETLSSKTLNLVSGAVGSPSLYLNSETTSGLYRIGANNHGWSISGAKVLDISSAGLGVTGNATVSGKASLGTGSTLGYAQHYAVTTFTSNGSSSLAAGLLVDGVVTGAAGDTSYLAQLVVSSSGITTNGTGEVHNLITTARFSEPVITLTGADTVNTAATVYIASAPTEGATNAALYVASGASYFGGDLVLTQTTNSVVTNSADAADTKRIIIAGGGTTSVTRGASIQLIGNDFGSGIGGSAVVNLGSEGDGKYFDVSNGSTSRFRVTEAGQVYIGDTSNANSTIGLTINQGANDNEILSLKSSDVAHGITAQTETDTFAAMQKMNATNGGVDLRTFSAGTTAIRVLAVHTTDNTTKTTAGNGAMVIRGSLKSGTGITSLGADANILVVANDANTKFILDGDGDSHQDVGTAWTNFDHLDDVATLDALAYNVARADDPIKRKFGEFLADKREVLEQQRLVTFNDDGHHFVNMSKLTMLHTGAIRQIGEKLEMAERVIERLTNQLQRLEMNHANPNH